jgi:hypothetical protein
MKALAAFIALLAWLLALTASGAAQIEVLWDQTRLERTLLLSSPRTAVCELGNSYRLSYEYELAEHEIAHCRHDGNATRFRLAVTRHAVFLDIDAIDGIGPEFDLEARAHLARLEAIAQFYGFSYFAAMRCLSDALAAAAMQSANRHWRVEPTELRSAQHLLQCEARRRGLSLVVASKDRYESAFR